MIQVNIQPLSLTDYVTLEKSFNYSQPRFYHLQMDVIIAIGTINFLRLVRLNDMVMKKNGVSDLKMVIPIKLYHFSKHSKGFQL